MTSFHSRRRLLRLAALATTATLALGAHAEQPWPEAKPITWIVGFVPGGTVDVLTRAFAKAVSDQIGQTIVIDNVPGASGALALKQAARAKPDGYTLVTVPGPVLFGQQQPEVGRELQAVGLMSQGPIVLVGGASLAPTDLGALIAAMKKNPQQWDYASSGIGTGQHLAGELFNLLAKTQLQHVAYKGGGPAMIDVMSGQVPVMFASMGSAWQHVKNGKLRAVAVGGLERSKTAPDLPTIAESGVPGYETYEWNAVFAPAGTPPEIVNQVSQALAKVLKDPQIAEQLAGIGAEPIGSTPADLDTFRRAEIAKWQRVVKEADLKLD